MGTFAEIYKYEGSDIPEENMAEFTERIEKLFQAGGMMDIERVQLYGKQIPLLRKATMKEEGMNFYYNYFGDESWENAGFNRKGGYVWSNKIGWECFGQTVIAAYVLEEIYTDGIAIALANGIPVTSWGVVAWINYLFGTRYHVKHFDLWDVFEACHNSAESQGEYIRWFSVGNKGYSFISGCEVNAVIDGTELALSVYGKKEKGKTEELAWSGMKLAVEALKEYASSAQVDKEDQLQMLVEKYREYFETVEATTDFSDIGDDNLIRVMKALAISDAPAFVVKATAEIYHIDFWELWGNVKDVVKRKMTAIYGNEGYYILPLSTEEFFNQSPDDMIPYWEEGCGFEFSEYLLEWFKSLRNEYDDLMGAEYLCDNVLKYCISLLDEANKNYYRIYAFSTFFEETLENLQDKRYLTLWRIFDKMIHEPEMINMGRVVFVPDESECRLPRTWDIMEPEKKKNAARMSLRRYLALVGNVELRKKVFGF